MRAIRKLLLRPNNAAHSSAAIKATLATAIVLALSVSGCSFQVPADPDGTLTRIEKQGVLRAGASLDPKTTRLKDGQVQGPQAELLEGFARQHHAEVKWQIGSEETLVTALEARKLDVVIGGITADTPWVDRAGVSRSYPKLDERKPPRDLVFLVPLGQNRLLSELEKYADAETKQ